MARSPDESVILVSEGGSNAPMLSVSDISADRIPMETPLRLAKGIKGVWTISAILFSLMFLPMALPGLFMADVCSMSLFIVLCEAAYLFIARIYIEAYYESYTFTLKHDAVYVEKGVIFKLKVMIPYSRIQNVDVYRGPLLRFFGLGDIKLFTAGTGMMESQITGINESLISPLSEKILSIARASRGSGVVGASDEKAPAATGAFGAALSAEQSERLVMLQEESLLELKKIRRALEGKKEE